MTSYYVETIERLTEQTIEQEIRDDIEEIRVGTIDNVKQIEQKSLDSIEEIRADAIIQVTAIKDDALSYIEDKKVDLCSFGNDSIEYAEKTYEDIVGINDDTDAIAEDTIAEIEYNIRQMIVDNGYVMKIIDDGNGNADIVFDKEVAE